MSPTPVKAAHHSNAEGKSGEARKKLAHSVINIVSARAIMKRLV